MQRGGRELRDRVDRGHAAPRVAVDGGVSQASRRGERIDELEVVGHRDDGGAVIHELRDERRPSRPR